MINADDDYDDDDDAADVAADDHDDHSTQLTELLIPPAIGVLVEIRTLEFHHVVFVVVVVVHDDDDDDEEEVYDDADDHYDDRPGPKRVNDLQHLGKRCRSAPIHQKAGVWTMSIIILPLCHLNVGFMYDIVNTMWNNPTSLKFHVK